MQVAMHGDLHAGNLLIDQRDATGRGAQPWAERFVAIDFCGARASGLPLFDLIRIAESLRTPHALLAQELAAHCALLGGTLDDAPLHAAASLADLGVNLECFPVERYRELADRVLGRLDEALNHAGELA
jgi:aminoglycoside phosphotransferase (APT) family kinase protein